jgi:hypothetical protein
MSGVRLTQSRVSGDDNQVSILVTAPSMGDALVAVEDTRVGWLFGRRVSSQTRIAALEIEEQVWVMITGMEDELCPPNEDDINEIGWITGRWEPTETRTWSAPGEVLARLLKQDAITSILLDVDDPKMSSVAPSDDFEGLTLFLSTTLIEWDRMSLQGLIFAILGMETAVHIAEYVENGTGDSCRVRLSGGEPDDLVTVAEHLAASAWRTEQKHALQAAGLLKINAVVASLDHISENLDKQELWAEQSGAREMLEDQAAEHIKNKDLALVRTWDNKLLRAALEVVKKKVGVEIEDGVEGLLPGGEEN